MLYSLLMSAALQLWKWYSTEKNPIAIAPILREKGKNASSKETYALETTHAAVWLTTGSYWASLRTDSLVYVSQPFQEAFAEIKKCIVTRLKDFSVLQRSFWTVIRTACCLARNGKTATWYSQLHSIPNVQNHIRNCYAAALSYPFYATPRHACYRKHLSSLETALESSQRLSTVIPNLKICTHM